MAENQSQYCMCITLDNLSPADEERLSHHRAALLDGAKWPVGTTITLRFLDGAPELQQRVKAVAREWTQLARLTFDFRDRGPTDIRIAFVPGNGSWSYLGTQCRQIAEPLPTMNFGWLTPDSSEDELRRVVLHEFGHALGLIHEHQNPKGGGIDWNRDAVIRDLSGPPNNWNEEKIESNMFMKYRGVTATDVDALSIMMYPIPLAWTRDGTSAGLNSELSATDKAFIKKNYPQ